MTYYEGWSQLTKDSVICWEQRSNEDYLEEINRRKVKRHSFRKEIGYNLLELEISIFLA